MSIHIKFKTARDHESIGLDGENISVIDLKKLLVAKKKLGKNFGIDYDLIVTNSLTNEDYKDDSALIPKNTSVIISRLPISVNRAMLNLHNANVANQSQAPLAPAPLIIKKEGEESGESNPEQDESDKINALIQHSHASVPSKYSMAPHSHYKHHHGQQQSSTGVHYHQLQPITIMVSNQNNQPQQPQEIKVPYGSYICFRCNRPGHYINQCPTNGDPNYDHHKRKKAAGIPKTFLKPLSTHLSNQQTGQTNNNNVPSIVLLNGGGVAVVTQNETEFTRLAKAIENEEDYKKKIKENKELEILQNQQNLKDNQQEEENNICPICTNIISDREGEFIITDCCKTKFCINCIRNCYTDKTNAQCLSCKSELKINEIYNQFLPNLNRPSSKKRNIDEVNSFSPNQKNDTDAITEKKIKYDSQYSPNNEYKNSTSHREGNKKFPESDNNNSLLGDSRNEKEHRDNRDSRDKDNRENRDSRDNRNGRDYRDTRDSRDSRDGYRDTRERVNREYPREYRDNRDKDNRENRDGYRESSRDYRDNRDTRDNRNSKDSHRESSRDYRDNREHYSSRTNGRDH